MLSRCWNSRQSRELTHFNIANLIACLRVEHSIDAFSAVELVGAGPSEQLIEHIVAFAAVETVFALLASSCPPPSMIFPLFRSALVNNESAGLTEIVSLSPTPNVGSRSPAISRRRDSRNSTAAEIARIRFSCRSVVLCGIETDQTRKDFRLQKRTGSGWSPRPARLLEEWQ